MQFFLFLWVLLGIAGCQSLAERSEQQLLMDTLNRFEAAVRWRSLSAAYGFLKPELQPAKLPEGLDRIRVSGYEVVSPLQLTSKTRAEQVAVIEYIHLETQVVRRLTDRQVWMLDAEKQWLRANAMPAFR